ncbi:MAG: hypothetical protein HQK83_04490 [Fibrobacteria bacterium]|nr:hypothetical protein [Fibrobacteria bacterium]
MKGLPFFIIYPPIPRTHRKDTLFKQRMNEPFLVIFKRNGNMTVSEANGSQLWCRSEHLDKMGKWTKLPTA